MDGYTLSISRCSGGDGVEESFKAKIKRREAALDAFAVAEAYCKESWMVSRCEREGFDGFIIDLCSDAEDETIRLVRLVPDSEDGIMDAYDPFARHNAVETTEPVFKILFDGFVSVNGREPVKSGNRTLTNEAMMQDMFPRKGK